MTAPAPALPPLVEGDRVRFAENHDEQVWGKSGVIRSINSTYAYVYWDNARTSCPLAWFVRATD
jgi:hypothetical protein